MGVLMRGWMAKRGPTAEFGWKPRYCELTVDELRMYADNRCLTLKGAMALTSLVGAVSFQGRPGAGEGASLNPQAPGDAVKHFRDKAFGFVLDLAPRGGKRRHLYYFDALDAAGLEAWTKSIAAVAGRRLVAEAQARMEQRTEAKTAARGSILALLRGVAAKEAMPDEDDAESSSDESVEMPAPWRRLSAAACDSKYCSTGAWRSEASKERSRAETASTAVGSLSCGDASEGEQDPSEIVFDLAAKAGRGLGRHCSKMNFFITDHESPTIALLNDQKKSSLAAIGRDADFMRQVPEALREDKAFVLEAVKRNGKALRHLPEKFRSDAEVVVEAVRQNPDALQFANEALRSDRDVVMHAVKLDGRTLRHSLGGMQADKEVVMAAVMAHSDAVQYAQRDLQLDEDLRIF